MKYRNLLILAAATLGFAACSDDLSESSVVSPPVQEAEDTPIVFGSISKGTTRADFTGADAAKKLGSQFVVSGYKGEKTKWDDAKNTIVFDNYAVRYHENTAYTTESNTNNWEYVGETRIQHAIDNGITQQATKYWDYTQPQYDFIAWSTGEVPVVYKAAEQADGNVYVSAITPKTAVGAEGTAIAYTMTGSANDLKDCYVADLVTVKKADYGSKPVTITFRSLGTKVRIGIYETVPGYSVRDVEFYSAAASDDADANKPRIFTTEANNIYTKGTYTIYYPTVDNTSNSDNNQAHIKFTGVGTQKTVVDFGALDYTIAEDGEKTEGYKFLGRTSATATMAGTAGTSYYTQYLPNEAGTNLNLRVNYTLESIDGSGETIYVKGATAQVPSIYTQWKSGFAYTYLFKISDKTNGYTGAYDPTQPDNTTVNSDPAGLYPITFDAVVVNDEDNDQTQETITLVSTPSITTYQKGSTVINDNEYKAATGVIYVTVNDGTAGTTPDLANGALQDLTGKANLYKLSIATKTEADVIDALQMQDDDGASGTVKGRSGLVLTEKAITLTNSVEYGVDGNTIEIPEDGAKKKAAKFDPNATGFGAGTYAFVYTKTPSTTTEDKFDQVTKAENDAVNGLYRYALVAATAGDVEENVIYFNNSTASTNAIKAFLGQGVSNMYLDNKGTQIASGYAVTGTDYYYTVDHGMTYLKATNVAYESFATANLFKDEGLTIARTETTPADGQSYYDANGKYCVILPQQTTGLYVIDYAADKVACGSTDKAVKGMTYFDKYIQNNGVYYTKVIKVQ